MFEHRQNWTHANGDPEDEDRLSEEELAAEIWEAERLADQERRDEEAAKSDFLPEDWWEEAKSSAEDAADTSWDYPPLPGSDLPPPAAGEDLGGGSEGLPGRRRGRGR